MNALSNPFAPHINQFYKQANLLADPRYGFLIHLQKVMKYELLEK